MPHQMMVAVFDTARHARAAMLHLVEADIPAHSIHHLRRNPVLRCTTRRSELSRTQRRRTVTRGALITIDLTHIVPDTARKILAAHHPFDVRIIQQEITISTPPDQQYEPSDFNDVVEMTEFYST